MTYLSKLWLPVGSFVSVLLVTSKMDAWIVITILFETYKLSWILKTHMTQKLAKKI